MLPCIGSTSAASSKVVVIVFGLRILEMAAGEPSQKARRTSRSSSRGPWWECEACYKAVRAGGMGMEEFCVGHAVSILGSEPGRAAMRAHLKVAQTLLRKAKDNVRRLEAAIQEDDGCNFRTVPTLLLTQCGFDDGGGGPHSISAGTVPVALALREPLPTGSHETLCRTLVGKPLALTFCKDRRFLCDVELPADIVDRLAPVPEGRKEMRPGAVLYKTGPKELYFFLRRSASEKERAGCKLFGYIHKEGLDVLSWKHTGDCFLYRKGCHVELRFLKVKFLDGDTADSGDEDFHSDSSAESLQ